MARKMEKEGVIGLLKILKQYMEELIADIALAIPLASGLLEPRILKRIELITSFWFDDLVDVLREYQISEDIVEKYSNYLTELLTASINDHNEIKTKKILIKCTQDWSKDLLVPIISFLETSYKTRLEDKSKLQGEDFASSKTHSQDKSDIQRYDVALSFAGEQRDYVEKVAKELDIFGIRVFYDKFHSSKMWGKNLVEFLQHVYEHDCKHCVIFVSKEYEKKFYTTHEKRSAISDEVKVLEDRIFQVKFDEINLPGIPTTSYYLKAQDYKPIEIARQIKDMIDLNASQTISSENHNQMEIDSLQSAIKKLKEKGLEAAIIHFDTAITLLRDNHGEDALLRLRRGLRIVLNKSIVRKGEAIPKSNIQMYEQIRMLFPEAYHHVRVFWEIVLNVEHQESHLTKNDISYAIRGIDLLLESLN